MNLKAGVYKNNKALCANACRGSTGASRVARDVGLNAQAVFDIVLPASKTNDRTKYCSARDQKPGSVLPSSLLFQNLNNWTEPRVPYLHVWMQTYEPQCNLKPTENLSTTSAEKHQWILCVFLWRRYVCPAGPRVDQVTQAASRPLSQSHPW